MEAAADLRRRFLERDTLGRLRMAADPTLQDELRGWLGSEALAEYLALAEDVLPGAGLRHLEAGPTPNLIFVPGVMGSLLASQGLGGTWWIDARSRHHLKDLRLSDDGTTDALRGALVEPFAVDPSYEAFLAAALRRDDLGHLAFSYDWRKPLPASAARLGTAIRQAAEVGGGPVHLVAHSMGGLLVRLTLRHDPTLWDVVGHVVFIGTPHYGSPVIASYLKEHLWGSPLLRLLGRYVDRATFRSLWGVLALLPAPTGVYPRTRGSGTPSGPGVENGDRGHPCAGFDLYRAESYHLDLRSEQVAALQRALDGAFAMHRDLYTWHLGLDQCVRDRMTVIAGVGKRTLFRLSYREGFGFGRREMARVTRRDPGDPDREGDGRVPLASAELEYVGQTRYVAAEHGELPSVPAVYEDVFRLISGEPMQLPSTPSGALTSHLAGGFADTLSRTPVLSGRDAIPTPPDAEDPGYLDDGPPGAELLAELEDRLAVDALPAFRRVRIL
jgi:hypothetical protein